MSEMEFDVTSTNGIIAKGPKRDGGKGTIGAVQVVRQVTR